MPAYPRGRVSVITVLHHLSLSQHLSHYTDNFSSGRNAQGLGLGWFFFSPLPSMSNKNPWMTGQGPRTTFILERSVGKLSWVGKRSQERAEPLSCVLSSASAEAAVQRLGETQSTAACFCSFLKTDGAPLRLAVGVGIWGGCVDPAKVWAQEHKAAQMRPAAQAGRQR